MPGGADSLALKRIDAHKTTGVVQGWKAIGRSEAEVSSDGKTTTIKSKAKNADGKEISSSLSSTSSNTGGRRSLKGWRPNLASEISK